MDRAQQPFQAEGLDVPSYVTLGNHDGLVQGNAAASRGFEDVATGCSKAVAPSQQITEPSERDPEHDARLSHGRSRQTDPTKVVLVPPDPQRQFVSTAQNKALHAPPNAARPTRTASASSTRPRTRPRTARPPTTPGARSRASGSSRSNTVGEGGVVSDHSSDGNIDDPQFQWLERELEAAIGTRQADRAVRPPRDQQPQHQRARRGGAAVHRASTTVTGTTRTRAATSTRALSTPIHLGEPSQRPPGDTTETLSELLLALPARDRLRRRPLAREPGAAFHARDGSGGFWNIKTAAEADWPSQSRLLEVMDNHDGTLSIFGTIVDHSAATAHAGARARPRTASRRPARLAQPRVRLQRSRRRAAGRGRADPRTRTSSCSCAIRARRYPRPKGATPLRVPLVPAYQAVHRTQPHARPTARVPVLRAARAGVEPAHGRHARRERPGGELGRVRALRRDSGQPGDAGRRGRRGGRCSITDVRRKPDLADYTGELQGDVDRCGSPTANNAVAGRRLTAATVVDVPFPVTADCAATADPRIGSTCAVDHDVRRGRAGRDQGRRARDLGARPVRGRATAAPTATSAPLPTRVFARQGLFVP